MKDSTLSSKLTSLSDKTTMLTIGGDEVSNAVLRTILLDYGVKEIISAIDEIDALEKLETLVPDLIFIDVSFSNMNWLEFCTNLYKGDSKTQSIPVIAVTNMAKGDERVKMLKINVAGVIHKPISPIDLANCINLYLQKSHLIKRLEECAEPTVLDLEIARNLQYTLLPDDDLVQACKENYNVEIRHIYQASQALGGDYWTVQQLPNGKLMVCVADFAGHGVSVALDTFRLDNYLKEFVNYTDSPAQILENMNDNFYRILPTGQYLTCFFGIIDTVNNTVTYAGAAVPPALLINATEVSVLDCSGTPIGAYPKSKYEDKTVPFTVGSSLMVYSDALVEINSYNKSIFTADSLLQKIQEWSVGGSQAIYDGIVECIKKENHHFDDDLTLVLLEMNPKHIA